MGVNCSQCGIVKGVNNHWFVAWWSGIHFHTTPIDDDPAMAREIGVSTVCGDGCAHKVYQRFLDYLKASA